MKRDITPLFISFLLMVISVFAVLFANYTINIKHYIGFVLILSSLVLYFKWNDIFLCFFGITLITGTLGFVDFFFMTFGFRIGIFQINPLIAILLLIFLLQNRQKIFPITEEDTEPDVNSINNFRKKFKDKLEYELSQIVHPNSPYIEEARIAAKDLLKEKELP